MRVMAPFSTSFFAKYLRVGEDGPGRGICVILTHFKFINLCFRFDALTELGAFMRTELLCISVLRVAAGPRVKLASCKSALNPIHPSPHSGLLY